MESLSLNPPSRYAFDTKGLSPKDITPDYVKSMNMASDRVLCELRDNELIRFGQYQIRDYDSGTILMRISEEDQKQADDYARKEEVEGRISVDTRTVKY